MRKHRIRRVMECENGMVHYESPFGMDCVTLCQISDWLGGPGGEETDQPITCQPCKWIMDFCRNGVLPK